MTPEQIAVAGGAVMQVMLDEHGKLATANAGSVDEMIGKNTLIGELIRDAAVLARENQEVGARVVLR
ncbi:hypothetical protein [Burkholderia sp. Nafp2/4-1b]|uniref:hypothetical protein n=1 Tax=Burkholderia sp. Nafp2/4-1b TaxID=2116686 RepID=UPI0013CF0BD4|nr:hypothetical protein [Burkholderia sp. Nafp2/4-1b]